MVGFFKIGMGIVCDLAMIEMMQRQRFVGLPFWSCCSREDWELLIHHKSKKLCLRNEWLRDCYQGENLRNKCWSAFYNGFVPKIVEIINLVFNGVLTNTMGLLFLQNGKVDLLDQWLFIEGCFSRFSQEVSRNRKKGKVPGYTWKFVYLPECPWKFQIYQTTPMSQKIHFIKSLYTQI